MFMLTLQVLFATKYFLSLLRALFLPPEQKGRKGTSQLPTPLPLSCVVSAIPPKSK